MVSLQSRPASDIFQFLFRLLHDLKQIYQSTLWVCDSGVSQPFSLDLQETATLLILTIQFHQSRSRLDLQISPETVLIKGEQLNPLEQSYPELHASGFQSLIPLPKSIQPLSAIAELDGKTLTLTLMKSYEARKTAKITVGERGQLLPHAMPNRAEFAEFN